MKVGQNNAAYIMQHWADSEIGERERKLINEYREKNNISDEDYAEIRETCNKKREDTRLWRLKSGEPYLDYEDENNIDFLKKHDVSDEEINEARETAAKKRKDFLQHFPDADEIFTNLKELDDKYEEGNKKRFDELAGKIGYEEANKKRLDERIEKMCDDILENKGIKRTRGEEGNKEWLDEFIKKTCDEVLGNKDIEHNANAANVSRFNSRFDSGMNLSANVQKTESEIETDYGLKG